MIDEDRTLQLYGYTGKELKPQSHKLVVAVCEECGRYRVVVRRNYKDMCLSCSVTYRNKMPITEETRDKLKVVARERTFTPYRRQRIAERRRGTNHTEETRQRMSATKQGIPYEEWSEYISNGKYCHKFNDDCRERNRDKYNRMCFLCGKDETDNGRKLSVHHVDMSKSQGCDGEKWKLVPLCMSCHHRTHNGLWQARIEYLIRS